MKEIGSVVAILDDSRLLVRTTQTIEEETVYRVFSKVPYANKELGIEQLVVPKGKVEFLVEQAPNVWLASTFDEADGKKVYVPEPSLFDQLRLAASHGLGTNNPRLKLTRGDPQPSALLDPKQSANVKLDRLVQVGDLVVDWDD